MILTEILVLFIYTGALIPIGKLTADLTKLAENIGSIEYISMSWIIQWLIIHYRFRHKFSHLIIPYIRNICQQ